MPPTSLDSYAPFDAGTGANVTEATWRNFMRHMLGSASGVIRGFLNEFAVSTAGTGLTVTADTGECWIRGHYGQSTALKTLAIAAAHATLARKDRVILRADFTNNRVEVDVLTGVAAASPVVPAVTQSTTIWETSLAIVDVTAADTVIAASQITDDRIFTSAHGRWRQATAQSIPAAAITKVVFDTVVFRTGDVSLNAAGTDFTLLRAGLWSITLNLRWSNATIGGTRLQFVSKVGEDTTNRRSQASFTSTTGDPGYAFTIPVLDRFAANDVIAAYAYQTSTTALSLLTTEQTVNITFAWVGP